MGIALKQRLDEYREDLPKALEVCLEIVNIYPWFSIVSTGAINHIRRGKTFREDSLSKLIIECIKTKSKFLIYELKRLK